MREGVGGRRDFTDNAATVCVYVCPDLGTPTGNNLGTVSSHTHTHTHTHTHSKYPLLQFPPSLSIGATGGQPAGALGFPPVGVPQQQQQPLGPTPAPPTSSLTQQSPQIGGSGNSPLLGMAPLVSPSSVGTSTSSQPSLTPSISPLITLPPPPQQPVSTGGGVAKQPAATFSSSPGMGHGLGMGGASGFGNNLLGMGSSLPPAHAQPKQAMPLVGVAQQPAADPLSALDSITVPLETIKPGKGSFGNCTFMYCACLLQELFLPCQ